MAENETLEKEEKEEKFCENCGKKLGPGRANRRFCGDACRIDSSNQRKRENKELEEMSVPDYIKTIQDILLKNRKILEAQCWDGLPRKMRMRELLGKNFNPKFFTSQAEPTDMGHVYRFCFEYGYWDKEDGDVVIICRDREVEV